MEQGPEALIGITIVIFFYVLRRQIDGCGHTVGALDRKISSEFLYHSLPDQPDQMPPFS
jgi:hypothetical protein